MKKVVTEDLQLAFATAVDLLSTSQDLNQAVLKIIPLLGQATACQWGTFWQVDPELRVLSSSVTWSNSTVIATQLESGTRNRKLSPSEGNAGHVWRSQKPIWTTNILRDMCIPRSLDAQTAGFDGGIWFALKSERFVFGVIELLGKQLQQPSADLLLAIERLGFKLGQAIELRKLD